MLVRLSDYIHVRNTLHPFLRLLHLYMGSRVKRLKVRVKEGKRKNYMYTDECTEGGREGERVKAGEKRRKQEEIGYQSVTRVCCVHACSLSPPHIRTQL